jgi:RNA polymerase sigma factor (sigma-70 family)
VGTLMMRNRRSGHSDAALIERARRGDLTAYGVLFERHRGSAAALARQLSGSAGEADDAVSEAFERVLGALRRGTGPRDSFRPYLLTAVRRTVYDRTRRESRVGATDEAWILDKGWEDADPSIVTFERGAMGDAFNSLPERWQAVLWHTAIEETPVEEIAVLFDMKPNAVAALAYRAREGLRQAYVMAHVDIDLTSDEPACRWTVDHLPKYLRDRLSYELTLQVDAHLDECEHCRDAYAEMAEVGLSLRALFAPLLLAPGAALLGSAGGVGTGLIGAAGLAGFSSAGSASVSAAGAGAVATTTGVTTGVVVGSGTMAAGVAAATVAATVGGAFVLPTVTTEAEQHSSPPSIAAVTVDWTPPNLDVVVITVPAGAAMAAPEARPETAAPVAVEAAPDDTPTTDEVVDAPTATEADSIVVTPETSVPSRPVGAIGDALVITPPVPKPAVSITSPPAEPEVGAPVSETGRETETDVEPQTDHNSSD